MAAGHVRVDDDPVTDGHRRYGLTDLFDDARVLVPWHEGECGAPIAPVQDFDIGVTDATRCGFQQDCARFWRRYLKTGDVQLAGRVVDDSFHLFAHKGRQFRVDHTRRSDAMRCKV